MKIAIWGAGNFGQYVKSVIEEKTRNVVTIYIDSNSVNHGKKVEGIEVISPEMLIKNQSYEFEAIVIAFLNCIEYSTVIKERLKLGNIKYGFVRNRVFEAKMSLAEDILFDTNIVWNDAPYLNKPILRSLETNIVDHCNLNCKSCSHFSNLFHKGDAVPFEVYCKDLKQLAAKVYIHQFNMLGGEAILHERIVDYIEFTRKLLPYTGIEIISNGLLLPKQSEEFFICCVKNDITISISGYKPTLHMEDSILKILKKYGITYIFRKEVEEFGKNIDLNGENDPIQAMKMCREKRCHFLRYGKIYKCPFAALGNTLFEHYNINLHFNEGFDIYSEELDWDNVIEKLYSQPLDICKYCGKEEKVDWKVENNPKIDDWVVH